MSEKTKKTVSGTAPTYSISFPKDQQSWFKEQTEKLVEQLMKIWGESRPNKSLMFQKIVADGKIVKREDGFYLEVKL